jgi:hypothetical protein
MTDYMNRDKWLTVQCFNNMATSRVADCGKTEYMRLSQVQSLNHITLPHMSELGKKACEWPVNKTSQDSWTSWLMSN